MQFKNLKKNDAKDTLTKHSTQKVEIDIYTKQPLKLFNFSEIDRYNAPVYP